MYFPLYIYLPRYHDLKLFLTKYIIAFLNPVKSNRITFWSVGKPNTKHKFVTYNTTEPRTNIVPKSKQTNETSTVKGKGLESQQQ